jgi:cytosine/adenosine deaminase-related metal-dependent hydrolase
MPLTTIHSVLLFDGTSTHENATVTFDSDHGRIISVSSGLLERPAGATIINGKGYTLVPGLIDAHIHCDAISLPPGADNSDALRASLRSGITTVCDMHSDPAAVKKWREDIAEDIARARASGGTIMLSDLKSALYAATIREGYPKSLLLGENPSDEVSLHSPIPDLSLLSNTYTQQLLA